MLEEGKFYWVKFSDKKDWEVAKCADQDGKKVFKFTSGSFCRVSNAGEYDENAIQRNSSKEELPEVDPSKVKKLSEGT